MRTHHIGWAIFAEPFPMILFVQFRSACLAAVTDMCRALAVVALFARRARVAVSSVTKITILTIATSSPVGSWAPPVRARAALRGSSLSVLVVLALDTWPSPVVRQIGLKASSTWRAAASIQGPLSPTTRNTRAIHCLLVLAARHRLRFRLRLRLRHGLGLRGFCRFARLGRGLRSGLGRWFRNRLGRGLRCGLRCGLGWSAGAGNLACAAAVSTGAGTVEAADIWGRAGPVVGAGMFLALVDVGANSTWVGSVGATPDRGLPPSHTVSLIALKRHGVP